ncbi:hypothetical protein PanWU01x14_298530, partial [Parasponia andersonii]
KNPCPTSSASSSSSNSQYSNNHIGTTSNSISNAIVPTAKMQTAIQFWQLVASIRSIMVACQLCTIT